METEGSWPNGHYPALFLLEFWRTRLAPRDRTIGLSGRRVVLLRSKTGVGVVVPSANYLAGLANRCPAGRRVAAGPTKKLADSHSNVIRKRCSFRYPNGCAGCFDRLVHRGRRGSSSHCCVCPKLFFRGCTQA